MRKMLVMALVMVPVAVLALTPPPAVRVTDDPSSAVVSPTVNSRDFERVRIAELTSYIRYLFEHKQGLLLNGSDDPYFFFAHNDAAGKINTVVFNESQLMDPASWIVQDIVEWTGEGSLRYISPSAYSDGDMWYPQVTFNCYGPPAYEGFLYDEGGLGAGIWTNPFPVDGPAYDYYLPLTDTGAGNVIFMDGQARDAASDSHIFKSFGGWDGVMVDPPGEVMIFPADETFGPNPVFGQGYENSQLVYGADRNGTIVIALCGYRSADYTDVNNPLLPVFRCSMDGGLTWADNVWLDQATVPDMPGSIPGIQAHYSNSFFDFAFDGMGNMHFLAVIADSGWYGNDTSPIWGLYDIHQTDEGWTASLVSDGTDYEGLNPRPLLDETGIESWMHSPSLAWGEDGTMIATWADIAIVDMADTSVAIGILMSYSHDNGMTWTDPAIVAADLEIGEYFPRLIQNTYVPAEGEMAYAYVLTMPTGGADGPLDMIKVPYEKNVSADMKPVVQKLDVLGPNPTQGRVTVALNLNTAGTVNAGIYNLNGQLVQTLHKGMMTAGSHELTWDGSTAAAGIYFARVTSGSQNLAAKVVLVK
ncbi:T9SS type A sorting domain-containing protein [Candidatus Fermentibacteria bacterium]|nr:T9SS type A sorting domain-containing protein [Candidatus Fermentibacteria bacterium]